MEYWDLYNADRKPLGRTHLRGDKFADGEFYVCCEIWVVNSRGEFLATRRHPDKKRGNMWEFTGGGTLAGETTLQSAVRELSEETGIKAGENEFELIATYTNKNYFMDIFLLRKDVDIKDIVLQPEETIDARWVTDGEIRKMIEDEVFVPSVGRRYDMYKGKTLQSVFESENIRYVKLSELLLTDYLDMINDIENVGRLIGRRSTCSEDDELKWVRGKLDENAPIFSMLEKQSGEFIGNIEIMDLKDHEGELGISITAGKQDKGYGTEAIPAFLGCMKKHLGLNRVFLKVYPDNTRAIHVYEKCGFKEYDRTDEDIFMEAL